MNSAEIEIFRARLIEEQTQITTEAHATAEDRATVELDQTAIGRLSRVDALQRQAMAQAANRRRGSRKLRITAALGRIEEGEFGYCQDCGEDMSKDRLSIDATTPNCVSCARG